jgi:23S rRNA pseudouridine1911/1915/1917 synthase
MSKHVPKFPSRSSNTLTVLFEDNHVLGVVKPGGVLVQGDKSGDSTLLDTAKAYLKKKYDKPGNVFVGLVHRVDRPVSGVVLLARTSKAASRLAREFSSRRARKTYLAVVEGVVEDERGELVAYVERTHLRSRLSEGPGPKAKEARLEYTVLQRTRDATLVEVAPRTGRHHQIRVQLASIGHPILGDLKYGAAAPLPDKTIALHAAFLEVKHPTLDKNISIAAAPPETVPWTSFVATIRNRFQ